MRIEATELRDVLLVTPDVHADGRGVFLETYHAERYAAAGIVGPFVQDNYSRSAAGTLRGLHLQVTRPQAKLIRVVHGEIFDVAVDVRRGSSTFGRWVGTRLAADDFTQIYIPTGFAHGFCVLSDVAWVEYKCSDFYYPAGELGIAWNDPGLGIAWPVSNPLLSERDRRHPTIADVHERLPRFDAGASTDL